MSAHQPRPMPKLETQDIEWDLIPPAEMPFNLAIQEGEDFAGIVDRQEAARLAAEKAKAAQMDLFAEGTP